MVYGHGAQSGSPRAGNSTNRSRPDRSLDGSGPSVTTLTTPDRAEGRAVVDLVWHGPRTREQPPPTPRSGQTRSVNSSVGLIPTAPPPTSLPRRPTGSARS